MMYSEAVEKVPKQILRRDAEKNDLTECTTINDLTIMRGHETPPKPPINYTGGFFDTYEKAPVKGKWFFRCPAGAR